MNIEEKARRLKQKLSALYLAFKRKDTPLAAKIMLAATIGYALSPIDLIPDFVPVLGYLDDIIILPLLITICVKLIPKSILSECEREAENIWREGKPKKWYYAIPIVAVWVLVAGLVIYMIIG